MTARPRHRRMVGAVGATAACALVLAASAAAATEEPTAELGSEELPVEGTFRYPDFWLSSGTEIVGAVHAVRRVEGGTAVYYSVGVDEGAADAFNGGMAFEPAPSDYELVEAANISLVDTGELTAYRPLHGEVEMTSSTIGMEAPAGQLVTVFAMFPELPETTTTVDLRMEWGVTVADVPVGEGALEPAVDEPFTVFGKGWPELPTADELATADPAAVTFDLISRAEDLKGTAAVAETPDQVEVTFDANVLFAVESAEVSGEARGRVREIAEDIAARGAGEITVTGHSDSVKGTVDNQTLSTQRAQAVADMLSPVVAGSDVTLVVAGKGPDEPVADNGTEEGRAKNRRVTVAYRVEGQK
ncbi:OmpA family protein [Georgenia sp. SYP-B2076]|uniref:OmpA family protein n=1 Tax=Georgenia sp. SYP-B2076 TaxID=2495881 RepID=UPI000F8D253A|nr:OmpA family protein [Georgenia sp. SYP-B2076]